MNKYQGVLMIGAALLLGTQALYAQTCNSSVTSSAPDSRYTDNGDGTVTDKQTGLMWKQCSEGLATTSTPCDTGSAATYSWQGALTQAQTVNSAGFAGYNDWRLPNIKELSSLVEEACYSPAINSVRFPETMFVDYFGYWSSSPYVGSRGNGTWLYNFNGGSAYFVIRTASHYTRLVRGGQ